MYTSVHSSVKGCQNMDTPTKPITGPYRATRLWNEAIRIFNNGVPRKRHWRQLKQYDNCFTASEATSWLHSQLKSNVHFGPSVSKEQTQQLLCKFLKAGVFEDVRGVESKIEHLKDNSGLYRLTNKSPFRNPRTPGRAPLSSLVNHHNLGDVSGSPKFEQTRTFNNLSLHTNSLNLRKACVKPLVQCHLTAKQLDHQEVEEVWKSAILEKLNKLFDNCYYHKLNPHQISGKWIFWNVTHVGTRGVVQAMDDKDSPPAWVLYGMKSLVNWPLNDDHKLPAYTGSEKDVFKVICDYFTNVSSPLTTFPLYNIFVEAFMRSESTDLVFRKPRESTEYEQVYCTRDSVQSLMMEMGSPVSQKMSTPVYQCHLEEDDRMGPENASSLPVAKSPLVFNRTRKLRIENESRNIYPRQVQRHHGNDGGKPYSSNHYRRKNSSGVNTLTGTGFSQIDSSACYETAFTTAEPITRMISHANISRRSRSSDDLLSDKDVPLFSKGALQRESQTETSQIYYSLDRLRSKSGGYVNVAAFGSMDCLDRPSSDKYSESALQVGNQLYMHHRSISSLSCHTSGTGLSPSSFSDSRVATPVGCDSENVENNVRLDLGNQILCYQSSPSKRLIGRRKGLEYYYGANACKPNLITPEGKAMAIELLQLLTLLLPPDHRRKLHLILRFMAKVSANEKLVLDSNIPIRTLVINTFYRCIICSPEEADYDELLAVRLVTFLMENAEAVMTVPHQLCSQVRDLLITKQRGKVSSQRFELQGRNESEIAIRGLLDHIIDDQTMSEKEKRKRLSQFQIAHPEIYSSRFPSTDDGTEKASKRQQIQAHSNNHSSMLNRIRNLRLI